MYDKIAAYIRQRVSVPDEALEKAFAYGRVAEYRKGDLILRVGEYCPFIGFINSGLIMVTLDDAEGREVICNFFFENEFFTYIESINGNIPSHKNFVALEDCTVLLLNKSEMPAIFSIHPAFASLYNQTILEDLQKVIRYVQEQQTQTVEERYLSLMDRQENLFNRIPLKYIAGYLGVAPPSLSRLRKRLAGR
ncbi:MAG TPA: Crp/Fnr family transcriptional regulator [Puia sp.]|nr:Crp/Fnr family transcriptional regulator [Puia sp.]